jgi:hypothetical protein
VARLAAARWITADAAVRRAAFERLGGFDERFPRAYREDSDFALRLVGAGYRWVPGRRRTQHPVRPADFWVSVKLQAGNQDDALMRSKYGTGWRRSIGEPAGRVIDYAVVVASGIVAVAAPGRALRRVARWFWLGAGVGLTLRRLAGGPWTSSEVARMAVTSAAIPPVAVAHRARGELRHRVAAMPLVRPGA